MNYWYSCRRNEVFIDCDTAKAADRAFAIIRKDLMETHQFGIVKVWQYPTRSGRPHCHVVIQTARPLRWQYQLGLANWASSDRRRTSYILARRAHGLAHTDLLVANRVYHRPPDGTCHCGAGKHRESAIVRACPALKKLLGRYRLMDFFPRTGGDVPKSRLQLPWGPIDLEALKQWR